MEVAAGIGMAAYSPFFVFSRVMPLNECLKKHLTSPGGLLIRLAVGRQPGKQATRVVGNYIPVAGESSQVPPTDGRLYSRKRYKSGLS